MVQGPIAKSRPASSLLTRPPTERDGLTERRRVTQLVGDMVGANRITVVAAPSGYGKTVALAAWARTQQTPVAWATLTAYDALPHLVDGILLGALTRVGESAAPGSSLRSLRSMPELSADRTTNWRALRDVLDGLTEPATIVIDDAQSSGDALADSLVSAMVEQGPPQLRIVIIAQSHPPIRLAKRQVEGEVGFIGPADLALNLAEATALAESLGNDHDAERLCDLLDWTAGWPVAMHLALLQPGSAGVVRPPSTEVGVERVLSGILIENVLADLPEPLADFVLAATTMSRLDPELARQVTGRGDSAELLEECAHRGLFLDRYAGDNGPEYRWHPVFKDLSAGVLRTRDPERARELHRTAARAVSRRGLAIVAMDHARQADDVDLAASIMRSNWLGAVLETRGAEAALLLAEVTRRRPDDIGLLLAHACTLDVAGDRAGAQLRYDQARAAIAAERSEPELLVAASRALAELILADSATVLGRAAATVEAAVRTKALGDPATCALALFVVGWTELRLRRDPPHAAELLALAATECERTGQGEIAVRAQLNLAFAMAFAGDFVGALRLLDGMEASRAMPRRAWADYDDGIEPFTRGFIAYYQDDLDAAMEHLRLGVTAYPEGGYAELTHIYIAFVAAARGDLLELDAAEVELRRRVPVGEQRGLPWTLYRQIGEAVIHMARGQTAAAVSVLTQMDPSPHTPIVDVLSARIHESAGNADLAREALARIAGSAAPYVRAHAMVTRALLSVGDGDQVRAHRLLEGALALSEPQDGALAFRGDDARLVALLRSHASWGTAHEEFVARQLIALDDGPSGQLLSRREHEILAYLRTTMTTAEIAQALFVSVNTVKTHQRAIYRKLGVSTRREAVRVRQPGHPGDRHHQEGP